MPTDAEKIYRSVFASVNTFFDQPHIKEFYRKEAEKEAAKRQAEQAAARAEQGRIEEKARKDATYDRYVLEGSGDECVSFGMNHGCQPDCPVFQRGECETQAELEDQFNDQ